MKVRQLGILMLLVTFISLASSNGLYIQANNVTINKTNGVDVTFNLNITNQENFKFYNITSQNSILTINKFDLESGQTKLIPIKITSNENFNGQIKIVGEYYTNLGSSSEIIDVTINNEGVDICNLDLIQGDTIRWNNTLSGSTKLRNIDTGEYFSTIEGHGIYSQLFNTPQEFDYQVYKTGLPFSNVCHINIRPESGYIHSSEYDYPINLNLKIIYEPTTISAELFTDSYTMNYNAEKSDSIRITNTGNRIAKNVKLSGNWFSFSENNFDLGVGDYKTITYTIKPLIYQTNQTNKTYQNNITIEGNFNTITKPIDIYINYNKMSSITGDSEYDKEALKNIVNFFCSVFPDDCPKTVLYGNESDKNVTITINEEAYRESLLEEDRAREITQSVLSNQSEKIAILEEKLDTLSNITNGTVGKMDKWTQAQENSSAINYIIASIFLTLILFVIGVMIMRSRKAKIKLKNFFGKDEYY